MREDPGQESLQALLVRHALGELAPAERGELERRLAADPTLAAEAASLQRTMDLIGRSSGTKPPARLRARLLESARNEIATRGTADRGKREPPAAARPGQRLRSTPFAMAASIAVAATIACAVLVADGMRLRRSLELQRSAAMMLREPNVVLSFKLDGSGAAARAAGIVLLDLDAKRASIAVRNLPSPPAGQAYLLWAVLESKNVLCGEFSPGADGGVLTQFAIPVDSYTSPIKKLILTIEREAAPAAPSRAVVMSS